MKDLTLAGFVPERCRANAGFSVLGAVRSSETFQISSGQNRCWKNSFRLLSRFGRGCRGRCPQVLRGALLTHPTTRCILFRKKANRRCQPSPPIGRRSKLPETPAGQRDAGTRQIQRSFLFLRTWSSTFEEPPRSSTDHHPQPRYTSGRHRQSFCEQEIRLCDGSGAKAGGFANEMNERILPSCKAPP